MKRKLLIISAAVIAVTAASVLTAFYAPSKLNADLEEGSSVVKCDEKHTGSNVWIEEAFPEDGKYYLDRDITLSSEISITNKVILCLNGQTITAAEDQRAFYIKNGGSLTICDCKNNEGKIISNNKSSNNTDNDSDTNSGNEARSVTSETKEEKKLNSAIYIEKNGNFTFESGTISDFSANEGGAVYSKGAFKMTGGVISDNNAIKGGGVYIAAEGGSFTMTGGQICKNTVAQQGGGVYVSNGSSENSCGIFNMNGGIISNNTIDEYAKTENNDIIGGGGVYTAGKFNMKDGTISGNVSKNTLSEAHFYGGGVCISTKNGKFTMNGGVISGNTGNYGGGVYVAFGTFEMINGKINGANNSTEGG
ncbi:MAG: hypothetical protein K2J79_08800, partial [Ruminiclostridium sp.]|nr:hypothetical protein [Ruminiclostridium sp.]